MNHSSIWPPLWARLFIGCLLVPLWVELAPAHEPELLTEARLGHRAARESIRTLTAGFTYQRTLPSPAIDVANGTYWRSQDTVRIQLGREGERCEDLLAKGGEIRQVGRVWTSGKPPQHSLLLRPRTELISPNDVWTLVLVGMTGPNGPVDMDGLLDAAKRTPRAIREKDADRAYIRVDLEFDFRNGKEEEVALWFDISRNYLVRKMVLSSRGQHPRSVVEVQEFAEPAPGIYFPVSRTSVNFKGNEVVASNTFTLSNIRINTDIPDQVLRLPPIPSGCELCDLVTETRYPVDADWRRTGPATRAPRLGFVPPALPEEAQGFTRSSLDEPTPLGRRVLTGSAGLLGFVLLFVIGRSVWRRRQTQTGGDK